MNSIRHFAVTHQNTALTGAKWAGYGAGSLLIGTKVVEITAAASLAVAAKVASVMGSNKETIASLETKSADLFAISQKNLVRNVVVGAAFLATGYAANKKVIALEPSYYDRAIEMGKDVAIYGKDIVANHYGKIGMALSSLAVAKIAFDWYRYFY